MNIDTITHATKCGPKGKNCGSQRWVNLKLFGIGGQYQGTKYVYMGLMGQVQR